MGLLNGFSNGSARFGNARLVAGSFAPVRKDGYILHLDASGARFGIGGPAPRWIVQFSAPTIRELEVLGVESRLTVTRLATLGLAGAGLRRNRTWIRVRSATKEAVFEVRTEERQTRAWCSQLPWARPNPVTPPVVMAPNQHVGPHLMMAELSESARLHATGALTDEEFSVAKSQILYSPSRKREAEVDPISGAVDRRRIVAIESAANSLFNDNPAKDD